MPKKYLKLDDEFSFNGNSALHCPACNGLNLHQRRTEIFERIEDAQDGTHVVIEGDYVQADRDLSGNPSGRRNGLTIHFICETCPADVQLHVHQHKGNTFIGMDYQEKPYENSVP